jgi:hypothetical protein
MKEIMQEFERLSEEANIILNRTFDCRQAELAYIKILNLIKENPDFRSQFVIALLSILRSGKAPWELIQFCMRELQWLEIKDSIVMERKSELEGKHDWRVVAVLNHILEVYEQTWEDAELYEYYSKNVEK